MATIIWGKNLKYAKHNTKLRKFTSGTYSLATYYLSMRESILIAHALFWGLSVHLQANDPLKWT